MTLEATMRLTEVLLGWALLQQSAEHLTGPPVEKWVFAGRLGLAALLVIGVAAPVTLLCLCGLALGMLVRFQGPYNGGSDRMGLLILICLTCAVWLPERRWQETVVAYLAAQLVLSYVLSGMVKLCNPDWRSGQALADVFAFSAYPVSDAVRGLATERRWLWAASWAVILFEVGFVFALISPATLVGALGLAAGFHLANACLFGLNRFFWTWIAAYPAILWLQGRLIGNVW